MPEALVERLAWIRDGSFSRKWLEADAEMPLAALFPDTPAILIILSGGHKQRRVSHAPNQGLGGDPSKMGVGRFRAWISVILTVRAQARSRSLTKEKKIYNQSAQNHGPGLSPNRLSRLDTALINSVWCPPLWPLCCGDEGTSVVSWVFWQKALVRLVARQCCGQCDFRGGGVPLPWLAWKGLRGISGSNSRW